MRHLIFSLIFVFSAGLVFAKDQLSQIDQAISDATKSDNPEGLPDSEVMDLRPKVMKAVLEIPDREKNPEVYKKFLSKMSEDPRTWKVVAYLIDKRLVDSIRQSIQKPAKPAKADKRHRPGCCGKLKSVTSG